MRISELIIRAIDCFYIKPVRALMPLQVFRYAVCGGVTYMLFDPLCYFLFYNFVVAHRYFDLGFVVISPHIAAMVLVFPAQPQRGVPPLAARGRDAAAALPAVGGGVDPADVCRTEILRGGVRGVAYAGEGAHDAADDGVQFPRGQIFHFPRLRGGFLEAMAGRSV